MQRRHLGHRWRRPDELTLKLVQFVAARELSALRQGQRRATWRELMREWNGVYPNWKYGQYSNFAKDYHRATDALLPPLASKGEEGTPDKRPRYTRTMTRFGTWTEAMLIDDEPFTNNSG
jgi:muconolactone delta-isomerase